MDPYFSIFLHRIGQSQPPAHFSASGGRQVPAEIFRTILPFYDISLTCLPLLPVEGQRLQTESRSACLWRSLRQAASTARKKSTNPGNPRNSFFIYLPGNLFRGFSFSRIPITLSYSSQNGSSGTPARSRGDARHDPHIPRQRVP